jgi:integrase
MKLAGRQAVERTAPTIHIGHRSYRDPKTGRTKTAKTWYAEWCVDGRRYYEALGTTNKAAVKAAHIIIQRIDSGQHSRPSSRVTIAELVPAYLDMLRNRGRAPKTLEKYEAVLNALRDWFTTAGRQRAASFTDRDFWGFKKIIVEGELAGKTCYDRLIIVKQLFKWAAGSKLIAANPLTGIRMDKPNSKVQPCFSPEQVATMLDKADAHEGAIYAVLAYTGMRFGEARDLRWADVQLDQGVCGFLVVQRGGSTDATKSRRVRRIPINPALREVLCGLPRSFECVFSARPSKKYPDGGGPIDERRLLRSLKRLCRRCKFVNPEQYKLHTFRHAFASMCARNNISYKYALEWMGHRNSDILDLYYTMFDDTAEAAIKTIEYTSNKPAAATAAVQNQADPATV